MAWPEIPDRPTVTLDELRHTMGNATHSVWVPVTREMVDGFARTMGEDLPNANENPNDFSEGGAQGNLLLSLLPWMLRSAIPVVRGTRMGVNYGYDGVRFLRPAPIGSRVRGRFSLMGIEEGKRGFLTLHYEVTMEIEACEQPALTCTWLLGRWIADHG